MIYVFIRKVIYRLYRYKKIISIILKLHFINNSNKKIYLFGVPFHPNLGDLAQTMCLEQWFCENYTDYELIKFDKITSLPLVLNLIREKITEEDLIFFHSGYHIIDHHPDLPFYCEVIKRFPDFKIVILPQTINLHGEKKTKEVTKIFNNHQNLSLMCRDEVSYSKAQEIFYNNKLLLVPDVVTTLIGKRNYSSKRSGILFLVRDDIEAYYRTVEIENLRAKFHPLYNTSKSDTTIKASIFNVERNRDKLIESFLRNIYSKYELVITDRYHGTIFSLVTNTPVIVISSADHKLSSGVKWFPSEFSDYITFAENLDVVYEKAVEMLKIKNRKKLPPYFSCNYYSKLQEML